MKGRIKFKVSYFNNYMISVSIKKQLLPYEADIRDLCIAFFPYQKIKFIEEGESIIEDSIIVENYFSGELTENRLDNKSEIKRQLYDYLSNKTGKKLLWGTLTGIRPVTIVTGLIENGINEREPLKRSILKNLFFKNAMNLGVPAGTIPRKSQNTDFFEVPENIKEYLKKEYYISDEKALKLIEIANREEEILNRPLIKSYKEQYSIYIGVPFCKSTCLYCSFTSFNIDKFSDYVDKYLSALENEFKKFILDKTNNRLTPLTIYIGGGTPTSLDEMHFEKLLNLIDKYVDVSNVVEYTVEAGRPDTITENKLRLMKEHRITRISINPQTFNDKTLKLIGRKHTANEIIEKFNLARKIGFDNINMDIILGLPNEKIFEVLKTLFNVYKLKPDSLTVHSLALKRAARLNYELNDWTHNSYLAGMAESSREEGKRVIDKMYHMSEILAAILSLKPYYLYRQKNMAGNLENVGYSKVGKESIYNIMMMSERHTVVGFGTATTKEVFYENNGKRVESIEGYKSVIDYCKANN